MAVETAEERAARERAEEEERRREERRREIEEEISGLEDTKRGVEAQIVSLEAGKGNLNNFITNWKDKEAASHNIEVLSEVVIINVFEGVCADAIKEELSNCVAQMNQTCNDVNGLNGYVGTQIDRLNERVMLINKNISSLQREYNSL